MTIPEISKLNWSTVKPTFEEVKGKTIIMDWTEGKDVVVMTDRQRFQGWFDDEFIRYAIIDVTQPDPEPLPLWRVMPEILPHAGREWFVSYDYRKCDDAFSIMTFCYPTRAEAINAWNKLAEPLNKIQL